MPHSTAKSAAFSIRHGWVSCATCRLRWWWCSTSPWCCSSSPPSSAWTSTAGKTGALTSSAASTGVHTHAGRVNAVHATSYFYPKNFIGANVRQMHISGCWWNTEVSDTPLGRHLFAFEIYRRPLLDCLTTCVSVISFINFSHLPAIWNMLDDARVIENRWTHNFLMHLGLCVFL